MPFANSFHRTIPVYWDESEEPNVAFYRLYYGRTSGVYDSVDSPKDMGNVTEGTFISDGAGIWYLAFTVVDTSNNESDFSTPELVVELPQPIGLIG